MAILNSNLINYYYVKQYLGWQIVIPALKKLPISYSKEKISTIENIVDRLILKDNNSKELEKELNKIIYQIYNIPNDLAKEIEEYFE